MKDFPIWHWKEHMGFSLLGKTQDHAGDYMLRKVSEVSEADV